MFDTVLLSFAMLCGWSLKAHLLQQRGVFLLLSDTKQSPLWSGVITAPIFPVRWSHQFDNLGHLHINSIHKAWGAHNWLRHICSLGLAVRLPQRPNCRILCFSFIWEEKFPRQGASIQPTLQLFALISTLYSPVLSLKNFSLVIFR